MELFRRSHVQRNVRSFFAALPRRSFVVAMLAGWALIAAASLVYFDFETLPPFVIEKLPVRFESLWLASLRVHVASALVTFPLCIALTTRALRRRIAWHRWLGRLTGIAVLFALVPSGVVLAFDAKGGAPVTAGFLVSAAIVAYFMVQGVRAARRRDPVEHRRAMLHVVGQMSVAVVSRILIVGLDAMGMDPDLAYVVALWGPVVASAVVVEVLCRRSGLVVRIRRFIERTRRERRPQTLAVGARPLARPVARAVPRLGR